MNKQWNIDNPERMAAATQRYRDAHPDRIRAYKRSPRGVYSNTKYRAKQRRIEFLLTYDQWWELWSNFWLRRGTRAKDMQMCRKGDRGAYAVGNVRIDTCRNNSLESMRIRANKEKANG